VALRTDRVEWADCGSSYYFLLVSMVTTAITVSVVTTVLSLSMITTVLTELQKVGILVSRITDILNLKSGHF